MGGVFSHPSDPIVRHVDDSLTTILQFIQSALIQDIQADPSQSEVYQIFDSIFDTSHPDGEQILFERLLSVKLNPDDENAITFSKERPTLSEVKVEDNQAGELSIHATMQIKLDSVRLKMEWANHLLVFPSLAPTDITLKHLVFDGDIHLTIDRTAFPHIKLTAKLENLVLHFDVASIGALVADEEISGLLSKFTKFYTDGLAKELMKDVREYYFSLASLHGISAAEKAMRERHQEEITELRRREWEERRAEAEAKKKLLSTATTAASVVTTLLKPNDAPSASSSSSAAAPTSDSPSPDGIMEDDGAGSTVFLE